MKLFRHLVLAAGLLPLSLSAQELQQIPNGGFEQWNGHTYTSSLETGSLPSMYNDLDVSGNIILDNNNNPIVPAGSVIPLCFLSTLNSLNQIMNIPSIEGYTDYVTRVTDAHSGQYAAQLTSRMLSGGEINIFVPGVIATLQLKFAEMNASLGTAYTSRPDFLTAWVKYFPKEYLHKQNPFDATESGVPTMDSGSIEVKLTSNGTVIAEGKTIIQDSIKEYTKMTTLFEYVPGTENLTPDSISIVFSASSAYNFNQLLLCQGAPGSKMLIDDISLENDVITGITTVAKEASAISVYPTLTTGIFYIQTDEALHNARIDLYDVSGRKVIHQSLPNQSNVVINVNGLQRGLYYYSITTDNGVLKSGAVIKN